MHKYCHKLCRNLVAGFFLIAFCGSVSAAVQGIVDGGYYQPTTPLYAQAGELPDTTFLRQVKGFAYDDLGAGNYAQVSVDLVINGVVVETRLANEPRPDVSFNFTMQQITNVGFTFDVPPIPPGSTSFTVDVRLAGTMTSLPGVAPFDLGGGPRMQDYLTPQTTPPYRYFRCHSLPLTVSLKGVRGEYYDHASGFTLVNPRIIQNDPFMNFTYTNGSATNDPFAHMMSNVPEEPPEPGDQADERDRPHQLVFPQNYGMIWKFQIVPLYTETYRIAPSMDDNVQIYVDGVLRVNRGCCLGAPDFVTAGNQAVVPLVAGRRHDVEVIFSEGGGGSYFRLWWSSPSQPPEIIPTSQLYINHVPRVDPAQTPGPNNDIPISLNEDTTAPINIVANDRDDYLGDTFTGTLLTGPVNGTLSGVFPNFSYTPFPDFVGTDSFTFRMYDEIEQSDIYTVRLTINPVDDLLAPQDDLFSALEDTATTFNPLLNDTAVDLPLTVVITVPPTSGVAVANADGTITYTPNLNYNGPDQLTYQVTDGDGDTGTAVIFITVVPVNDPPVAGADSIAANQDLPRSVSAATLLANDADLVEGEALFLTSVSPASSQGGTVSLAAGVVTYTPKLGFVGTDTFTYVVADASGGTATGLVTVTVAPAPFFTSTPLITPNPTVVGQQVFFSAAVSFPQGPGPITWNFGDGTAAAGATVTHTYANAGYYTVIITAFDADGGRVITTQQVLVSFNLTGETGNGAATPPGAGILIGGAGVGGKTGKGKILIDYLRKERTSFQGSLTRIKFPPTVTQSGLLGKVGVLTIGQGALTEQFVFNLNEKGKGQATALATIEVNIAKGSIKLKASGRPGLTPIAESLGAAFDRDNPRAVKKLRLPVSLIFDQTVNFALAMTFEMTVKQSKSTAKGATGP